MARPLRLEFTGAIYHVTSRGDRQEEIYRDDVDRLVWLEVLELVCDRYNWVVHAYCQMSNHYHLLIETPDANLSKGMRQLNGVYTQRFNRRYNESGHLFQGRFKAILVQRETYLLELTRYVILNPLRARMVDQLDEWSWSSYLAMIGAAPVPKWLDSDWLLSQFHHKRSKAIQAYIRFIMEGKGLPSPLKNTRHQLLLGDESFVGGHRKELSNDQLREVSMAHRKSMARTLEEYEKGDKIRELAMAKAYLSGAYTMAEIGAHFSVHYITVSRAVRKHEM